MSRENERHPLTTHIKSTMGMTTKGWAEFNGLNPNMTAIVIYNGYYDPEIVKKLRDEGLYGFLYEEVRAKIEEAEKSKTGGNGNG